MTRQNGRANAAKAERQTEPVALNRFLAMNVAGGNAGATLELVAAYCAGPRDRRADGRFWFVGGEILDHVDAPEMLERLTAFVTVHRTATAEAVYRYSCEVLRRKPAVWPALPLPMRMAFTTFRTCLLPLLEECDALDAAAVRAAQLQSDPPNRGVFKRKKGRRNDGRRRGIARRNVLTRPQPQVEAAE